MVVATRIYSANSTAVDVEQHEPPDGGPSSVRIRCKVTVQYASRKLGGKGLAVTDRQDAAWTSEVRFPVDDPSLFSRYDELCGAARDMLKAVPRLGELDLSPDNWDCRFAPEVAASQIRGRVHRDENQGRGPGWHYHFAVKLELVVTHVYSEPRAVLRWCGENVMQTVVVGSGEVCGVCMEELLRRGAPPEPVNLPCSHAFHEWCILPWLHQGSTCPACRHDLRGLVVAPWKPRSWMQKHAAR